MWCLIQIPKTLSSNETAEKGGSLSGDRLDSSSTVRSGAIFMSRGGSLGGGDGLERADLNK
jgi:hypothetical protein